jgi:hypothetical protein
MKKKPAKLTLTRETVRTLRVESLTQVVGGIVSQSLEQNGCVTSETQIANDSKK